MSACACKSVAFQKACDSIVAALDRADLDLPESIRLTIEDASEPATSPLMKSILGRTLPVIKTQEEKFALGIVLEPLKEMGQTDSQNDLYSAEEVRKAAHVFMEEFADMGVQHTEIANSKIKILESWIQRDDAVIEGTAVTKGTWMMAVRFVDDDLWTKVKKGEITGFSIGGIASRTPVPVSA
jgi:DNA adenine methylase